MTQWKDKLTKLNPWRYQFEHQGKRYGARGFLNRDAAREAEVEHRKRVKNEIESTLRSERKSLGFREVSYEYLLESERKFVKKTHDFKVMVCRLFLESLTSDLPIENITSRHIKAYLETRPSNNSWNAHRKDLHTVFEFAKKNHYIDTNPVSDVDVMPHTPARKKIPTEEQVVKMIDACDPAVERPLFLAVLHTLGRIDELLRLTWDDVNFERKQVVLWTRKRKGGAYEADPMPMNKELEAVMQYLLDTRTQDHWVFLNPKTETRYNRRPKFMKGICRRAFDPECKKIKDYTGPVFGFHALRHFMASWILDKGKGSLKDLQRLLRHKEARTTEIYLQQVSDNLRTIMEDAETFASRSGFRSGSDEK
jgi:integrase